MFYFAVAHRFTAQGGGVLLAVGKLRVGGRCILPAYRHDLCIVPAYRHDGRMTSQVGSGWTLVGWVRVWVIRAIASPAIATAMGREEDGVGVCWH